MINNYDAHESDMIPHMIKIKAASSSRDWTEDRPRSKTDAVLLRVLFGFRSVQERIIPVETHVDRHTVRYVIIIQMRISEYGLQQK